MYVCANATTLQIPCTCYLVIKRILSYLILSSVVAPPVTSVSGITCHVCHAPPVTSVVASPVTSVEPPIKGEVHRRARTSTFKSVNRMVNMYNKQQLRGRICHSCFPKADRATCELKLLPCMVIAVCVNVSLTYCLWCT